MIPLVLGLIVGFGMGILLGKLSNKKKEISMIMLTPLVVYIISLGFYGGWNSNVFLSTPFGDFKGDELVGVNTFLAVILVVLYLHIRSKNTFSVDEFPSFSNFRYPLIAGQLGLAITGWKILAIPSIVIYLGVTWLWERDLFMILNAKPCSDDVKSFVEKFGYRCLMDSESIGVYKFKDYILVGGRLLKACSRWRDIVRCISDIPTPGKGVNVLLNLLYLLPLFVGFLLSAGDVSALIIITLVLGVYLLSLGILVRISRRKIGNDCRDILGEYRKFLKESKKKYGKLKS
ncbi:hypothetical protein [Pyrococcus sp. ST04]|uniref:hypothetical protein n=1 Tax=Pyrococcus sp. ST04 TaxID=1183377 RepID=UPI0002605ED9|nr:hypothetical protein [Pyrococcus sp. ST04]AFK23229.1 hypothetical protein Py04_1659 [Pyrococcus sp. ST04]